MSETVAAGHLRAFIERIERVEEENAAQRPFANQIIRHRPVVVSDRYKLGPKREILREGVSKDHAGLWLEVCRRLCKAGGASEDWAEERKGFTIACRLTGLGWNEVQKALLDVAVFGVEAAAAYWKESMRPADERMIGFVYSAYSPAHQSAVKIGFSTAPDKRMKALTRRHGVEIRLGACLDGTMLHEWALHQILRKQIAPEWYRTGTIPDWLMPMELREAA